MGPKPPYPHRITAIAHQEKAYLSGRCEPVLRTEFKLNAVVGTFFGIERSHDEKIALASSKYWRREFRGYQAWYRRKSRHQQHALGRTAFELRKLACVTG
jgi:hypothetical protein